MARPRLSDPGIAVRVRVRASDLDLLKQAAKDLGQTPSELYRRLLHEYLKEYMDANGISKPVGE